MTGLALVAASSGVADAADGPFGALPEAQRAPSSIAAWPLDAEQAVRAAGDRVSVRVRRPSRAALVRVTRRGAVVRTVRARDLRRGQRASFVLPARADTLYALSLSVRSAERARRYRTWIYVPAPRAPEPGPVAPAPAPPPPPAPQDRCGVSATPVATLAAERTSYSPGEWVTATLANQGHACLNYGEDFTWERASEGGWALHGTPGTFPSVAYILEPGQARAVRGQIPCESEPGRYRMVKRVGSSGPGPASEATVAAEFEVGAGSCS